MSKIRLILGDCVEKLKELSDNSVDSIVTDPPYGWSFMGKKWDYDLPKVEVFKEMLRVLKSGGHILCACGTRTQHRMAVNIEDAGFEIRDIVAWVYGSGFPKSLNIGKAVDKLQGNEREVVGKGLHSNIHSFADKERYSGTDFKPDITKGSSPYEGWGTALKPAMELWTLARKPLSEKTVAENVLKWGTGGINIDQCRVSGEYKWRASNSTIEGDIFKQGSFGEKPHELGRFPANLIHDGSDEVVGLFPNTKSVKRNPETCHKRVGESHIFSDSYGATYSDSGSAARFFYCAKSSKAERNRGGVKNHHPTVKPIALMRYLCRLITPKNGIVLDPFMGSGTTGIAAKEEGFDFIGIEREEEYLKIAEARIGK